MLTWFLQSVKLLDVYNMSLYLSLKGTSTSKTFCGGILSIILIVIFFILSIYLFIDLSTKQNQYYTLNNLRYNDPPNFNITPSIKLSVEKNVPFFFFALYFHTNQGNSITIEEFNKFFYLEAQLQYIDRKNNSNFVLTNRYELSLCDKDFKSSTEYLNLVHYNENNLLTKNKTYYCLDDSVINVEGDFVSEIYRFLSIKFKDCKNNPNKNVVCNTDKDKFVEFIDDFNIDFIYSFYYIKSEILDDVPLRYFTKRNTFKISQRLYQKFDYYLSYSRIETEENLLLKFFGSLSNDFITTPKIVTNHASVSSSYIAIYLRSNYDYISIRRSYKTFFNLISQLGGIWKFLIIIGVSIISKFNLKSMLNILGNSIYSVISGIVKKNADRDEKLEIYKNKGNEAFPHFMITSNNKSELETKLYIDIYKYERNRGLHISMKDMILQTYFTCLLKPEKREIKKLQEKLENEILMKLDFIKVLRFIKQFKIFKIIILYKKSSLVKINKDNNIEYKHLQNILRKIQQKRKDMEVYNENDEEKRIIREAIFIKGLRYYRNKPVIDKNIDARIFNLFKWDKTVMGEYLKKNIEIKDKE